ncbi:TPA: hypothetical protein EYN98_03570 [Candidatus Poribacteria bacterium]|nr:hypothetical protein [Candidatus Poribacteria bacterium]HIA65144.1 hypothetical protein [Candidatus Poribacteria bacterium]HIB85609.1 hypothetical protein [Candidatus Poribacteria bacterium]HIC02195.1 hypothetical protein [Candidatus Poribacteria bacterium]HIC18542.1 hypothetical protein [Candidatus Poribacteria bacterium]
MPFCHSGSSSVGYSSSDLSSSQEDIHAIEQLIRAGKYVQISILDHFYCWLCVSH